MSILLQMKKNKLLFAAEQLLSINLHVKRTDILLLIYDSQTKNFFTYIKKILAEKKIVYYEHVLDMYSRPAIMTPAMANKLKICTITIYGCKWVFGEHESFASPLLRLVKKYQITHVHMPGLNDAIIRSGLSVDYTKVAQFTRKIHQKMLHKKSMVIQSAAGTNLTILFNPNYTFVADDGIFHKGGLGNLPAGEVFTCPQQVNGVLCVDGVIGNLVHLDQKSLQATPLKIVIKNSRIVAISSKNKKLVTAFKKTVYSCNNGDRVGEVAIGTNIYIPQLLYEPLHDEKFPSFHMAFGDPISTLTKATWKSKIHVDCIILKPTIILDLELVMDNGIFQHTHN